MELISQTVADLAGVKLGSIILKGCLTPFPGVYATNDKSQLNILHLDGQESSLPVCEIKM
jgi:hypothetical protein